MAKKVSIKMAVFASISFALILTIWSCARASSKISRLEEERELHREIEKME